jgi:hypothetical protein
LQLTAATASHGTIRTNDRTVAVAIESLATNATATLTLTLLPTLQALGRATNTAEVSSGSPPDAVLFNNRVGLEMLVLPADADRDGQPDDWEIAHGLDPANPLDATVDSDCDGATNLQEYQAGTDPLRFDGLRLDSVQFDSQGQCVLTIRGAVGKTYTVETSTNFPHWSPLTTFLCRETTQRVNTPLSRNAASTFFRLRSDSSAPLPFLTLLNGPLLATPPPLLQVTASPGWRYSVQASTNLASWTEITNYVGVSCATVIADPAWSGQGRRFYRALRQ